MGADHAGIVAADLVGAAPLVVGDPDAVRAESVAGTHGASHVAFDSEAESAVQVRMRQSRQAPISPRTARHGLYPGRQGSAPRNAGSGVAGRGLGVKTAEQNASGDIGQPEFMRRDEQSRVAMKRIPDDGSLRGSLMMRGILPNGEASAAGFPGAVAISDSAPQEFDMARHVRVREFAGVPAFQSWCLNTPVAPVEMLLKTTVGQLSKVEINSNTSCGHDALAELRFEKDAIAVNTTACARVDAGLSLGTCDDAVRRTRIAGASRRQEPGFRRIAASGLFPEAGSDRREGRCGAIAAEAGARASSEGRQCLFKTFAGPESYA